MSQQSPERPPTSLLNSQKVPLTKSDRVNVQVEIQQIRRIVNGANKRLERLCEQIVKK